MKEMNFKDPENQQIHEDLVAVYNAMKERGYDAVNQLTGFTCTSDETYITPYNNARKIIKKYYGEDIIKHLLTYYFED